MKTAAKFIIDRNGKECYYVEKYLDKTKTANYDVYLNNKEVLKCNDHNFHAIYNADDKISVGLFARRALMEFIKNYGSDPKQARAYDKLEDIIVKINNSPDKKNPILGLQKHDLLEAIGIYNDILTLYEEEIPYMENYELVTKENSKEKTRNRVTKISNLKNKEVINDTLVIESNKELVRTKKYDHVM